MSDIEKMDDEQLQEEFTKQVNVLTELLTAANRINADVCSGGKPNDADLETIRKFAQSKPHDEIRENLIHNAKEFIAVFK